ncbi:MAG: hypothetical protein ACRDF4_01290, partial [Rhabdochlamydiaceae bacterium]
NELKVPKRFTTNPARKNSHKSTQIEVLDPIINRLLQANFASESDKPTIAVVDRGSEGVEPITYLIGRNATELAVIVLNIARTYSEYASP